MTKNSKVLPSTGWFAMIIGIFVVILILVWSLMAQENFQKEQAREKAKKDLQLTEKYGELRWEFYYSGDSDGEEIRQYSMISDDAYSYIDADGKEGEIISFRNLIICEMNHHAHSEDLPKLRLFLDGPIAFPYHEMKGDNPIRLMDRNGRKCSLYSPHNVTSKTDDRY